MYAWIWRRLPFGLAGKLAGMVLIATALVAVLWYVVFPWAEPLLPFDDVQVTQDSGDLDAPAGGDSVDGPGVNPDDYDIPYSTETHNTPPPSSSR
jgi:hypothetical protein